MKTAVSIPDKIFRSADSLAKRLGVSRSRLYADALADFLSRRQSPRRFQTRFSSPRRDRFLGCVQPEPHPDRADRGSHVESPAFGCTRNVPLAATESGLPKDSVANVSQLVTLDKGFLSSRCGRVPPRAMMTIDAGLKLALSL